METKRGKISSSIDKGLFFFDWLRQKSDYMKLRGGENMDIVCVDVSINKFRNGEVVLDGGKTN